jgi:ubiquinone biosynthesis protein
MQIQPQLILLQKTLLNIEGLGRELYPELDLWKTAQPVLRQWMRERMSPRAILRRVRTQLPDTIEALKHVPQIFQAAVRAAAEGRSVVRIDDPAVIRLGAELRRANGRRDLALAAGVLWLSGLACLALFEQFRWVGWLQLSAAAALVARYRWSRDRWSSVPPV